MLRLGSSEYLRELVKSKGVHFPRSPTNEERLVDLTTQTDCPEITNSVNGSSEVSDCLSEN